MCDHGERDQVLLRSARTGRPATEPAAAATQTKLCFAYQGYVQLKGKQQSLDTSGCSRSGGGTWPRSWHASTTRPTHRRSILGKSWGPSGPNRCYALVPSGCAKGQHECSSATSTKPTNKAEAITIGGGKSNKQHVMGCHCATSNAQAILSHLVPIRCIRSRGRTHKQSKGAAYKQTRRKVHKHAAWATPQESSSIPGGHHGCKCGPAAL